MCSWSIEVITLQSVTSSGKYPSVSRRVGSAPDWSNSSTISENSQVEARGETRTKWKQVRINSLHWLNEACQYYRCNNLTAKQNKEAAIRKINSQNWHSTFYHYATITFNLVSPYRVKNKIALHCIILGIALPRLNLPICQEHCQKTWWGLHSNVSLEEYGLGDKLFLLWPSYFQSPLCDPFLLAFYLFK